MKAIFWDRDGTLNEPVYRGSGEYTPPWSLEEFILYKRTISALRLSSENGFLNFVVTNQPDVGQYLRVTVLDAMHQKLRNLAPIRSVRFEFDKSSNRYKPGNGMIEELIREFNIDRDTSFMIGDRWKDMLTGEKSGLSRILITQKENSLEWEEHKHLTKEPEFYAIDAFEAVEKIIYEEQGP